MRLKKALVALVSIGIFAGVTPAHAVTNGYPASSDTAAGSIAKVRLDNKNCSAVMISPSWALTAKHCVRHSGSSEFADTLSLTVGVNLNEGKYIAKVYPNPDTDIALLNIDGVHKGVIAELPQKEAQVGDTIQAVGFGPDTNSAQYVKETLKRVGWSDRIVNGNDISGFFLNFDNVGLGELRRGDSGGGGFVGNELHGIFANGILNSNDVFSMYISYVNVFRYLDWIYDTTGIVSTPSGKNVSQNGEFSNNYVNPTVTDNGAYNPPVNNSSSGFISSSSS